MAEKKDKDARKVVATHRKARQFYEILETFEAGLALLGPEVKSLRQGRASLDGCFGREQAGELFLFNFYIPPYSFNTEAAPPDPRRSRKLLLRKAEIDRISRRLQTKGLTLVPLEVYFRGGWAKASIALARGKTGPDRRQDLKKKDSQRDYDRSFKGKFKA